MSDHLTPVILNALADGELSSDQLASANEHLAACPSCTSSALFQTMLKTATSKAGQRYTPPSHLQERLAHQAQHQVQPDRLAPQTPQKTSQPASSRIAPVPYPWSTRRFGALSWAAALALLLVFASILLIQRSAQQTALVSSEYAALVTEVCDQHIATLAANSPPQVLSSDRHTVKPWFQGKLPFSFNLPEGLPSDTTLDGANLTYLHNRPVAQLLYHVGKHRVSVFIQQPTGASTKAPSTEHSGFHVICLRTQSLEVVAVSDADPTRLSDLANRIEQAQTNTHEQPR